MGTVYLAERAGGDFTLKVAIKVVREGLDSEDILRRFLLERRALASLDHPNIARLIDGGATESGRPYLVMELVEGVPIDEFCRTAALPIPERVRLFRTVCAAVQHAHARLVVHRDLKPSNILVTPDGTIKLLDFGIAKLLESEKSTEDAAAHTLTRIHTPRYASPEQIRGERTTIATDVYSLGVILYELLTDRSPNRPTGCSESDLQQAILAQEPQKPSVVQRAARGKSAIGDDLDTIVLKALRKEPERRYASVEQLSEDLRREAAGLPVLARPDTFRYRAGKFVRRNWIAVGAATAVTLTLIAATVVSSLLLIRSQRAHEAAARAHAESEAARTTAEHVGEFLEEILASMDPEKARGRDTSLLADLFAAAASRIETELADQPDVAARLNRAIALAYRNLGEADASERHLRLALANREAVLARATPPALREAEQLGAAYADLGFVVHERGRYGEADSILTQGLSYATAKESKAHQDLLLDLATTKETLGQTDSALVLLADLVAIRRETLGPSHPDLALTLNNYGRLLMRMRSRAQAGPILAEAVSILRAMPEEQPNLLAGALFNHAEWLRDEERFEESESCYREALEIQDRLRGPEHPRRLTALTGLASVLERSGQYAAAESLYREGLATRRRIYAGEHRDVGMAAANLAGLLVRTGGYAVADTLFREAIAIYARVVGPEHAWVAAAKSGQARLYERMGRYADADRIAGEALEIARKHWPENHEQIAILKAIRGSAAARLGRHAEGEALLLESAGVLAPDDESAGAPAIRAPGRDVLERLVALYESWGRSEAADHHRRRLQGNSRSS
jgi:serine/threonine-protein kinase